MEVVDGKKLIGKISRHGLSQQPVYIQVLLDDQIVANRLINFQQDLQSVAGAFECELPRTVLGGLEHKATIEVICGDKVIPLSNQVIFQSRYIGKIDYITNRKLIGWVANLNAPGVPVELDVYINGRHVAIEKANLPYQSKTISGISLGSRIGFDIELPNQSASNSTLEIELKVGGCDQRVFYESQVFTSYDTVLRSLEYCTQLLNQDSTSNANRQVAGIQLSRLDMQWLRENLLAPAIREIRRNKSLPNTLTLNLNQAFPNTPVEFEDIVDVIVPTYKGKEETLACLESVARGLGTRIYEIIVINDHSPDPELTVALKKLAGAGKITLIEHTKNQGFVRSVNAGMRLHPTRDVVLLNSDTVVPNGWLDRLSSAAYSAENIGTVTPFTNSGTICSFPEINLENELPEGVTLDKLDQMFAATQSGTFDLPTAVGFCMYIKRQTLQETGLFDEDTWKKGYGEENDFCLRAGALGWRSVIATNLFVQHHGSVSFAAGKNALIAENLPKLNHLYPDYESRVNRFIKADSLARYRTPVIKELLKLSANRFILFVVHSLGGGAGYAADTLANQLLKQGEAVLILSRLPNKQWQICCLGKPYRLVYDYPSDQEKIIDDLKMLNVWHIHYHQIMDFPANVMSLAQQLGVTYDFSAHDFMPICPRVNFVDETDRFCGESRFSEDACTRCIEMNGLSKELKERYAEFGHSVSLWRAGYKAFLKGARRVISPSYDTGMYYREHYDLDNLIIKSHPEEPYHIAQKILPPSFPDADLVIAVIGGIGLHKGYRILMSCAQKALKDRLPIRFVVIGHTYDDELICELPNVEVTGEYKTHELSTLINQYGCKIAVFLSTWPETFSYTLSEAWINGLYPVALGIGAISERIKETGFGELLPLDATPKEINNALINAAGKLKNVPEKHLGREYSSIIKDYYDFDA